MLLSAHTIDCSPLYPSTYDAMARLSSLTSLRPSLLPVKITLIVPARKYSHAGLVLQPTMTGAELKVRLISLMAGDKIKAIECRPDSFFVVRGVPGLPTPADGALIRDDTRPVLELALPPGSIIELVGDILHQDDLPKRCFADTFSAASPEPIDYYTCKTCKLNWLCGPCTSVCHAGHEIVVFAKGHVPKWACCYCVKSKSCALRVKSDAV